MSYHIVQDNDSGLHELWIMRESGEIELLGKYKTREEAETEGQAYLWIARTQ